jgi:hypothetical protein
MNTPWLSEDGVDGQGVQIAWGKGKILSQESTCASEDPKENLSDWMAKRG